MSPTTDLPISLPTIRGDPERIGQVLINLLSNALSYTPTGGQVGVTAKLESAELVISISDSGQGIPSKDLPYVFERFYRADKSSARASGGSGLGLAIARQIIEAHGGRIGAENQAGLGSTFAFSLPAKE